MDITRDFGEHLLASTQVRKVRASDTVMRLLAARRHVETAYGGGFVESIDGLAGTRTGRRDWFYYVDGSEAPIGAADYTPRPRDVVQWDYHRWDATLHVPAIVGAYPRPFTLAPDGRRPRTVLECGAHAAPACATVKRTLSRDGATVNTAPLGAPVQPNAVVAVVAPWSAARAVLALRKLESGPSASGVFARFADAGSRLILLDGSGHPAQVAPAGSGLVAATSDSDGTITWIVSGTDETGVSRAAAGLSRQRLRNAFALALLPRAERRLPVG